MLGAVVAVTRAVEHFGSVLPAAVLCNGGGGVWSADLPQQESRKICEGYAGSLVFLVDYVQLSVVKIKARRYVMPAVNPLQVAGPLEVVLEHTSIREVIGRSDGQ